MKTKATTACSHCRVRNSDCQPQLRHSAYLDSRLPANIGTMAYAMMYMAMGTGTHTMASNQAGT